MGKIHPALPKGLNPCLTQVKSAHSRAYGKAHAAGSRSPSARTRPSRRAGSMAGLAGRSFGRPRTDHLRKVPIWLFCLVTSYSGHRIPQEESEDAIPLLLGYSLTRGPTSRRTRWPTTWRWPRTSRVRTSGRLCSDCRTRSSTSAPSTRLPVCSTTRWPRSPFSFRPGPPLVRQTRARQHLPVVLAGGPRLRHRRSTRSRMRISGEAA